jgi:peptidyl-dipeptidase A
MRTSSLLRSLAASLAACCAAGCAHAPAEPPTPAAPVAPAKPTAQEARDFVARVNAELKDLWIRASTAEWIKNTYITEDSERNAAWANEAVMAYQSKAVEEATRFDGVDVDPETARALYLLKISSMLPAPKDPAKRAELASIAAKLDGMYGKGKWCGQDGKGTCRDLDQLSDVLSHSRKWDELVDAWAGWHTIAVPMKPLYARQVELADEGAREIGFRDLGELWRDGYDMSPADFEKETDRLWEQLRPFYEELHCYVRSRLQTVYGKDRVPDHAPIPAHLLGNMWAQEWTDLYPLLEPYKGQGNFDVDTALARQKYDHLKMVKLGESFFTSLGFEPLPQTFWERSQFLKPRDREVVCHASAWDVSLNNDLRIKMCIRATESDLITIHHELGHDFYYSQYYRLPALFQSGANDGFHEAIGDAIALSITPSYLKRLGLIDRLPKDDKGLIDVQMKSALSKIAFLPFGKLVDQWRWDVFAGKVTPDHYNQAWWDLKLKYQGVVPPVPRSEADFDPGAKYHVPGNTPYMRYFIAAVLQFQFHKALCDAAGWKGPLHECSIYGSKEAGAKFQKMLALGASKPWQDALFELTGTRQMDASAILEYYAPLRTWLAQQNQGKTCGW